MIEWLQCPHGMGLPHLLGDLTLVLTGFGAALATGYMAFKVKLLTFFSKILK